MRGPEGRSSKREPSPGGLGINPEDDLSAVGAALNRGPAPTCVIPPPTRRRESKPTRPVSSRAPPPQVLCDSSAPQKAPKGRVKWIRCERCRQAPVLDVEHGLVPTHRGDLQTLRSGHGRARLPHSYVRDKL